MQSDVEKDADLLDCFSFAMDGASLAGLMILPTTPISLLFKRCSVTSLIYFTVVWTYMHDDMSKYAGPQLESALKAVQDNYMRKWQAINMFRYTLPSINYPWVIKSHSIDLLLTLVDENLIEETNNDVDFISSAPQVFATLKVMLCLFLYM